MGHACISSSCVFVPKCKISRRGELAAILMNLTHKPHENFDHDILI